MSTFQPKTLPVFAGYSFAKMRRSHLGVQVVGRKSAKKKSGTKRFKKSPKPFGDFPMAIVRQFDRFALAPGAIPIDHGSSKASLVRELSGGRTQ